MKKTKQTENFGYSPMTNGNGGSSGSAQHFKVIDTEGMPTGLQSVKEDQSFSISIEAHQLTSGHRTK